MLDFNIQSAGILRILCERERKKRDIIFGIDGLFLPRGRDLSHGALLNVNGASPVNYYSWFLIFVWWPTDLTPPTYVKLRDAD